MTSLLTRWMDGLLLPCSMLLRRSSCRSVVAEEQRSNSSDHHEVEDCSPAVLLLVLDRCGPTFEPFYDYCSCCPKAHCCKSAVPNTYLALSFECGGSVVPPTPSKVSGHHDRIRIHCHCQGTTKSNRNSSSTTVSIPDRSNAQLLALVSGWDGPRRTARSSLSRPIRRSETNTTIAERMGSVCVFGQRFSIVYGR